MAGKTPLWVRDSEGADWTVEKEPCKPAITEEQRQIASRQLTEALVELRSAYDFLEQYCYRIPQKNPLYLSSCSDWQFASKWGTDPLLWPVLIPWADRWQLAVIFAVINKLVEKWAILTKWYYDKILQALVAVVWTPEYLVDWNPNIIYPETIWLTVWDKNKLEEFWQKMKWIKHEKHPRPKGVIIIEDTVWYSVAHWMGDEDYILFQKELSRQRHLRLAENILELWIFKHHIPARQIADELDKEMYNLLSLSACDLWLKIFYAKISKNDWTNEPFIEIKE